MQNIISFPFFFLSKFSLVFIAVMPTCSTKRGKYLKILWYLQKISEGVLQRDIEKHYEKICIWKWESKKWELLPFYEPVYRKAFSDNLSKSYKLEDEESLP